MVVIVAFLSLALYFSLQHTILFNTW